MYVDFDNNRIKEIQQRCCDSGIGDAVINMHNMTAEHTEILGQFLDCTGLNPIELMIFLENASKNYKFTYYYKKGENI